MFYTIYDAIVFKAEKNGIKEEEVRKKLRKRGFTSERLGLLKNNCTTLLTEEILTIIFDEFGLRKLEIDLMLGKVPKEYEESYLSNVSAIADLLKKEEFQKRKAEEKKNIEFKTDRGILYHADCVEILPQIQSDTADLIFADPPFNLKKEYANGRSDDLTISEYINWSKQWLDECVRILKPGGSLYIYNIPKWCIYYAEYLSSKLCFQNWIAIDMKNSFPVKDKYTPSHYGLLYFTKGIKTSVYKGYKQDKIEMRGDRAEMSDFPLYLNTVAGGLDRRDQTIGGFSFVVKIYTVPVVEIIG